MGRRRGSTNCTPRVAGRSGAARTLLLAVVLVAGALVFALVRFAGSPGPAPPVPGVPSEAAPEAGDEHEPPLASPSRETATAELPPGDGAAPSDTPGEPGTIEVSLVGWPDGAPEETEVLASRWRSHPAAEAEVVGRLVIPRDAERGLLHLGPGSYALQARAAGWTSAPVRAELGEPALRAEVVLTMTGCAAFRGFVLGDSGDPVQDLAVHLIDGAGQLVDSARTAFGGSFEMPCVPPGNWSLVVGMLEGPVLGPREVVVDPLGTAPGELVLPPLGAIEIAVQDEAGAPVPDLELSGQGGTGGRLELRTDFGGSASSELALPGLWRFFADAGPLGRGNAVLEVEAGGRAQATLTLRRPR